MCVNHRVSELEREVATLRARNSQDKQLLQRYNTPYHHMPQLSVWFDTTVILCHRLLSSVVLTEHLFQKAHPSTEDK